MASITFPNGVMISNINNINQDVLMRIVSILARPYADLNQQVPAQVPVQPAPPQPAQPAEIPDFMHAKMSIVPYNTETLNEFISSNMEFDTCPSMHGAKTYGSGTIRLMINYETREIIGVYTQTSAIRQMTEDDPKIYNNDRYNKYIYDIQNCVLFNEPITFRQVQNISGENVGDLGCLSRLGSGNTPFTPIAKNNLELQAPFRRLIRNAYIANVPI